MLLIEFHNYHTYHTIPHYFTDTDCRRYLYHVLARSLDVVSCLFAQTSLCD